MTATNRGTTGAVPITAAPLRELTHARWADSSSRCAYISFLDSMEEIFKYLDKLGSRETYNHYPVGLAMAFNTPFKMWKSYAWNDGICDPMMVHWLKGIKLRGEVRDQYAQCSDVVPTVYD